MRAPRIAVPSLCLALAASSAAAGAPASMSIQIHVRVEPDAHRIEAQAFHRAAHELAHFWWLVADPATPDDWINEGLAQYAALRLSSRRFGTPFRDHLRSEYLDQRLHEPGWEPAPDAPR